MRALLRAMATIVIPVLAASPAAATTLSAQLPKAAQLVGIQNPGSAFDALGTALADTVARTLPVLSASAGYTYRYDPTLEAFVRTSETLGPLFLERPDTLGRGKFNVSTSFQYVELNQVNGQDAGSLQSPFEIVLAHSQAGTPLPRTANTLKYSLKLINNIEALSVTYGVLDQLDVNVFLPLLETDFDVVAKNQQRAEKVNGVFQPAPGPVPLCPGPGCATVHGSTTGIGDILVRSKYQLPRWMGVRSAAGLQLRLPVGSEANLQGTGSFEASPAFYASVLLGGRVEVAWNGAVDLRANDVAQSQARYGVGADMDVIKRVGLAIAFLGRSEFERSSPAGATSFLHRTPTGTAHEPLLGIDFRRNDFFDFSFGTRIVVWRQIMMYMNGIVAINDAGLRNDSVIPTVGFEGTF